MFHVPRLSRKGIRRKARRSWFALHGAIGIATGLVLGVIVLSGTIATFGDEIDWLIHPELRVSPTGERVPWGSLIAAAEATSEGYRAVSVWAAEASYLPSQVYIITPEDVFRTVYVDPFSGAVLSDGDIVSMQWFFRHLHMRFFLPDHGILLVGLFGVTLLVSTVTGVLTFKKWWRNAFRMRLGKGRRVFWGDFHRSSGVWSLWFLILISLTGIWYGVEELLHDAGRTLPYPPFPKVIEIPADAATRSPIPVDAAIAAAQAALPGLEPGALRLSITPSDPIVVHGLTGEVLVRDRINAVFVNPYDGQVIEIWSAAEAGLATRWVHTVDRLHFGDFGGLIVKLVWFVAGLTVTVQIISGSWLWCRHRRTKQTSEARRLSPPPSAGRTGALAVSPRLLDSLHREEKYRSRP